MRRALLPWGPAQQVAPTGTGLLIAGPGSITYSEAWETTGTASAAVTYYDGNSANGRVLTTYTLSEGQSTSEQWALHTMPFDQGLYVATTAGAVEGSLTAYVDYNPVAWLELHHRWEELQVLKLELELASMAGR